MNEGPDRRELVGLVHGRRHFHHLPASAIVAELAAMGIDHSLRWVYDALREWRCDLCARRHVHDEVAR